MIVTREVNVKGMQCCGCETIPGTAVGKIEGIHHVKANYHKSGVIVVFDTEKTNTVRIQEVCTECGYTVSFAPEEKQQQYIKTAISLSALARFNDAQQGITECHVS